MSQLNHGMKPLRQMFVRVWTSFSSESGQFVSPQHFSRVAVEAHFMVGSSVMAVTHCELVSSVSPSVGNNRPRV